MVLSEFKSAKIGLIGPNKYKRCGITEYLLRLYSFWKDLDEIIFVNYEESLKSNSLIKVDSILLHYEAGLAPHPNYLFQINEKYHGKVHLVPHEVYEDDPFAFPYSKLKSSIPLLLPIKQFLYKIRHKNYSHEKHLQSQGYYSHKVIPLSDSNFEILKNAGAPNLSDVVPLAFDPMTSDENNIVPFVNKFFLTKPKFVLGLFGFMNPATDYELVLSALEESPKGAVVLFMGGTRQGDVQEQNLKQKISLRGLKDRAGVTGFISEEQLYSTLNYCDAFICPFKFKSNSSSILKLINFNKPILTSDIPIMNNLISYGAPLQLYKTKKDILNFIEKGLKGQLKLEPNEYPFTIEKVISMYRKILNAQLEGEPKQNVIG